MKTTIAYLCPNCTAPLVFSPDDSTFACDYCRSRFDEATILKREEEVERRRVEQAARDAEEYCNSMEEYVCPNCGAEVVADANTAATHCCYCHTPVIHRGKLSGQLRPTRIVPFRLSREAAEESFLSFAKKYKFVPRGFFAREHLEKMQGIYYPFWITDADANARMTASATKVRSWSTGKTRYTETSRYRIERAGQIHFEDITTAALSEADKQMLEGVLPYPSDALEPFAMPYLSGYLTKKRDLGRGELQNEVNQKMDAYAETILCGTVGPYTTLHVDATDAEAYRENWEYALMPLYILVWRGKKRNYTYAVNGYTGKVYGELPVSRGKLWALWGAIAGVLTTAATLIGGFLI